MLACWPVCPTFLRRLFVRAFTAGLAPDGDRVRESEWRKAMVRLHDSVVFCASCGRENLADVDDDGAPVADVVAVGGQRCWSCGARLALPPRLVLASHPVVLAHDTVLHGYHLAGRYDFTVPAARSPAIPRTPASGACATSPPRPGWPASPAARSRRSRPAAPSHSPRDSPSPSARGPRASSAPEPSITDR